ncbi:hypothetical protein PIB30_085681 [Stylosanthes scabra]|uniref:Uncharacterized protein n=1 Tax=Stylosanthes scabra TaxID=79078 RepID=A0ABU6WST3_9FABA|nr:hypothetical protein [Stylosanthes scabra]
MEEVEGMDPRLILPHPRISISAPGASASTLAAPTNNLTQYNGETITLLPTSKRFFACFSNGNLHLKSI